MKNILHALCKYYLLMLGDRNDANCKRYVKYSIVLQQKNIYENYTAYGEMNIWKNIYGEINIWKNKYGGNENVKLNIYFALLI